ncbi:MAG: hypothetical protein MPJ79_02405 [Alphaproteobacteria bacterium]|nr:hypothetical protein [Alphaproteobacteria bacterium]MDA7982966.1 hypothetical protein [Alphaproteobacteria bacterium]MDA7989103.1 hypothetical protein [Alphaproteobacteria bacterium]MDA8008972.1 hypothetical protein [Alphaproteobacteria bacterium]
MSVDWWNSNKAVSGFELKSEVASDGTSHARVGVNYDMNFWSSHTELSAHERLKGAMWNLPLPAAFRDAPVAIRAIIRQARKDGEGYEDYLRLLYEIAAVCSFLDFSLQEVDGEACLGFNVVETLGGANIRALRYSWETLGYQNLALLKATDVKWMVAAWGEPSAHTSLNEMYRQKWMSAVTDVLNKQRNDRENQVAELRRLIAEHKASRGTRPTLS